MATNRPTVWEAKPHTIAKNVVLHQYLLAWFLILGTTKRSQNLVYIDGFAGPGEYTNYPSGSPVQAIEAAESALSKTNRWLAGNIYCFFIEADEKRFENLKQKLASLTYDERIHVQVLNAVFESGISSICQVSQGCEQAVR